MKTSSLAAIQLLHEGAIALAQIEAAGVRVDEKYVTDTIDEMSSHVSHYKNKLQKSKVWKTWKRTFGEKTKLGSREQLAHVLFDKLGYKSTEQTATGLRATNKKVLDKIDHSFVRTYRKIEKLEDTIKTYLLGPRKEMVQHDDGCWFIHPNYHIDTVSTYRSSCRNPNFQNVPARDLEMAEFVRRSYIPYRGHLFVEIDFGQIEVRVAACLTKDPALMRYVTDPTTDMHRDMAMQIFFLTEKQAADGKKSVRHMAKNMFVFPEFYGQGFFRCAEDIWEEMERRQYKLPGSEQTLFAHLAKHGIKELGETNPNTIREQGTHKGTFVHHMKLIERDFWDRRFSHYTAWKRSWYEKYQKNCGFDMMTGFIVNGQHDRNDVINYPIQGPAFHCELKTLIHMTKWIRKYKMKSRIVGEIHDSDQASVHPKELQDYLHESVHYRTKILPKEWKWLIVPLEAESEVTEIDEPWSTKSTYIIQDGTWKLKE